MSVSAHQSWLGDMHMGFLNGDSILRGLFGGLLIHIRVEPKGLSQDQYPIVLRSGNCIATLDRAWSLGKHYARGSLFRGTRICWPNRSRGVVPFCPLLQSQETAPCSSRLKRLCWVTGDSSCYVINSLWVYKWLGMVNPTLRQPGSQPRCIKGGKWSEVAGSKPLQEMDYQNRQEQRSDEFAITYSHQSR